MKARVGVGTALLALVAGGGWFGHAWREEAAASARATRDAGLAVAAQLAQLSSKVDRLERSLSTARADTVAACAKREAVATPSAVGSGGADAATSPAPVDTGVGDPIEDPGSVAQLAAAEREVDEAIRRGRWSTADGLRFETTIASLRGELREHALSRLSQAINAGRLDPESGAFPF